VASVAVVATESSFAAGLLPPVPKRQREPTIADNRMPAEWPSGAGHSSTLQEHDMFPFADNNPTHRTPFVTYALILVNVLAFLWFWRLDEKHQIAVTF
jgi:hypothetical protein